MDATEVLDRVPEVAEAVREARSSAGPHWTLHVRDGVDDDWVPLPLATSAQVRSAGIAFSELGFHVCAQDDKGCVRLRLWPVRQD